MYVPADLNTRYMLRHVSLPTFVIPLHEYKNDVFYFEEQLMKSRGEIK